MLVIIISPTDEQVEELCGSVPCIMTDQGHIVVDKVVFDEMYPTHDFNVKVVSV